MDFEFDPLKSEANRKKHGIDFAEAQVLWDDPDRLEIPAKTQDEARSIVIGQIRKKHGSIGDLPIRTIRLTGCEEECRKTLE